MATCVVCQTAATVYCENDKAFLCAECDQTIHSQNRVAARHVRSRLCECCQQQVATVYCHNDKVFCCDDCDAEVHLNNPLAAMHHIVPAAQAPKQASEHNASNPKAEAEPIVAEAHSETPKVATNCCHDHHHHHHAVADDHTTSHSNSDAVVPVVPVMDVSCDDFLQALPQPVVDQKAAAAAPVANDNGVVSIPGKPWKDFDALELDNGWLDRLEMGFDFSDILDNGPTDDAGLVPTLNPSFPENNFPADSFPAVPDVSPEQHREESSNSLKRAASFDLESFMPSFKVPFSGPPGAPSSPVFDFALPTMSEQTQQPLQPQQPAVLAPVRAPLAAAPVPAMPQVVMQQPIVAAAGSAAYAAMEATSGAGAMHISSHPLLTREQRVQRYREKRSRRNFEKTIRYASRKAYAEVRPRIKGRFARKEEVLAWQAANPGMAVPEIIG